MDLNGLYLFYTPLDLFAEQELILYYKNSPFLPQDLLSKVIFYRSTKRRKELLLSRFLIHQIMNLMDISLHFYDSLIKKDTLWSPESGHESKHMLHISFSHSQNWIVLALADTPFLSIDIECSNRKKERLQSILRRLFCNCPIPDKLHILLHLWNVHEALLKLGFSIEEQELYVNYLISKLKNIDYDDLDTTIYKFDYLNISFFLWQQRLLPGPGILVTNKVNCRFVKAYRITKESDIELNKPCKKYLAGLIKLERVLELPLS